MRVSENKDLKTFLSNCGVPPRYLKDTDRREYHINFEEALESATSGSLFVFGGVGTGKTQLVVDVLSDLAESKKVEKEIDREYEYKGQTAIMKPIVAKVYNPDLFRFYNVPKLLIDIRSLFGKQDSLEDMLEDISRYEYLVLDDLGVEKITDWVLEMLYVLINSRYENEQKIFITSNKSLKEIAGSLGDRLASRIVEMCKQIELKGEDKRLK